MGFTNSELRDERSNAYAEENTEIVSNTERDRAKKELALQPASTDVAAQNEFDNRQQDQQTKFSELWQGRQPGLGDIDTDRKDISPIATFTPSLAFVCQFGGRLMLGNHAFARNAPVVADSAHDKSCPP